MANGITDTGPKWVTDPNVPGGSRLTYTFFVVSSALIGTDKNNSAVLAAYPQAQDGSFAICLSEGVCKVLIDGAWG